MQPSATTGIRTTTPPPADVLARARAARAVAVPVRASASAAWVPDANQADQASAVAVTAQPGALGFVPTQRGPVVVPRQPATSGFVPDPVDPGVSRYAVLALVMAVLGLAPVAVPVAHLALRRLACSQQRGRSLAVVALAVGYGVLALAVLGAVVWLVPGPWAALA